MVGNSRAAHFHHSGNIDDTFFTVTKNPKNTDSGGITELFEDICKNLKIFSAWYIVHKLVP